MKNKITQDEYDLLTFLKSTNHQLERLSDRFFYYAKKVVKTDDNDWLTDYFNDVISVEDFLKHTNIEVEKQENENNQI
jgi:hypothetical protein